MINGVRPTTSKLLALLGLAALLLLAGCGGGGEGSGGGSGPGYTVTLTVSSTTVPAGGQITLLISVRQDGVAVPDGSVVGLSSSLGGTFSTVGGATAVTTSGGQASAIFNAPSDLSGTTKLTASFQGAYAYVWVLVQAVAGSS